MLRAILMTLFNAFSQTVIGSFEGELVGWDCSEYEFGYKIRAIARLLNGESGERTVDEFKVKIVNEDKVTETGCTTAFDNDNLYTNCTVPKKC